MSPLTGIILFAVLAAVSGLSIARSAGRRGGKPPARSRSPARDQPKKAAASNAARVPVRAVTPRTERPLAAPWMTTLKKALNHGGTGRKTRSEAKRKQVQIATVDPETGRPSVRTVVFRGFLPQKYLMMEDDARTEESCCFCFITDDRSAKFSHLGRGEKQGAPIECCWWLDEPGVHRRSHLSSHGAVGAGGGEAAGGVEGGRRAAAQGRGRRRALFDIVIRRGAFCSLLLTAGAFQ